MPGARLRFHADLPYWHKNEAGNNVIIHRGPAMLARIDDAEHRFIGCHCTWIDLSRRKGKAVLTDPATGEILEAKKLRGSQKGGYETDGKMEQTGFIDAKEGPAGAYHYVLLFNPHKVVWDLKDRIQENTFRQLQTRAIEIGAKDMEPAKAPAAGTAETPEA